MAIDHIGTTVVPILEEDERILAACLVGEALAVLPREEPVTFTHDHHERLADLLGESFKRHVPRTLLCFFGRRGERTDLERAAREWIEVLPRRAQVVRSGQRDCCANRQIRARQTSSVETSKAHSPDTNTVLVNRGHGVHMREHYFTNFFPFGLEWKCPLRLALSRTVECRCRHTAVEAGPFDLAELLLR